MSLLKKKSKYFIPVGNRGFCVGKYVDGLIVGIHVVGIWVGIFVVGFTEGYSVNLLGLYVGSVDGTCVGLIVGLLEYVGENDGAKVGLTE